MALYRKVHQYQRLATCIFLLGLFAIAVYFGASNKKYTSQNIQKTDKTEYASGNIHKTDKTEYAPGNIQNTDKTILYKMPLNKIIPNKSLRDHDQNLILFYGIKWWESAILKNYDVFQNCSRRCNITTDVRRSNEAKVLIMQADIITDQHLPEKKDNQIWVLSEFESPQNMKAHNRPLVRRDILKRYRRMFNWTMGYRRDADFVVSHGRFKVRGKKNDDYQVHLDELMKTKTKLSIWFNSHCPTIGLREKVGEVLKKYMHLDIFGTCGKVLKACNPGVRHKESFGFSKDGHGRCMDFIDKEYKFFMSFENTLCLDYVTEKSMQRIMPHFIVPVVRTYVNHSLFHPPGSIVDTSKFTNAETLASFLNNISDGEYRAFYSWRKHYELENLNSMWLENVCRMCERSYEPEKYVRVYDDIYSWVWKPNGRDVCKTTSDIH